MTPKLTILSPLYPNVNVDMHVALVTHTALQMSSNRIPGSNEHTSISIAITKGIAGITREQWSL